MTLSPLQPSARLLTPAVLVAAAWFGTALATGAAGVFDQPADSPPAAIGVAAVAPPLAVVGLLAFSARFRSWVRDLDLRFLTLLQTWRVAGVAFLALSAQGDLAAGFALPAGLGDVAVGLTAPLVALYVVGGGRGARRTYVAWSILGIADLLAAVALGVTAGSGAGPMSVLPMSLIPTFGVPVTLALHAICLVNAVGSEHWTDRRAGSASVAA
jgi:hypothetical protein